MSEQVPVCTKCCRPICRQLTDQLILGQDRWHHAEDGSPLCWGGNVGYQQALPLNEAEDNKEHHG